MARRIVSLMLAMMMVLMVSACGAQPETEPEDETEVETVETEKPETEEAESAEKEAVPEAEPADLSEYEDGQEFVDVNFETYIGKSVNSSGTAIPKEKFLMDLLIRFWLYTDGYYEFDSRNPANPDNNIMIRLGSDDMANPDIYDLGDYQQYSEDNDPRGWSEGNGIIITDKASADWIAANIFNLSEESIEKAAGLAESQHEMYAENGKYYGTFIRMGIGMVPSIDITECKADGNKYYLAFDFSNGDESAGTRYAVTEIKNIDGIWYWTLHSFTQERIAELG